MGTRVTFCNSQYAYAHKQALYPYLHILLHIKKKKKRSSYSGEKHNKFSTESILDPNRQYIILGCTIKKKKLHKHICTQQMRFFCKLMCIIKPIQKGHLNVETAIWFQIDSTSASKFRESPFKKRLHLFFSSEVNPWIGFMQTDEWLL